MEQNTVIYPGTFDPITRGHSDLVSRASKLFTSVIVAIAANPSKQPIFSLDERMDMAKAAITGFPGVQICRLDGLLVDFARKHNARAIIRGLRAVSDFEYEFQLASMNRKLAPDIETLFLTPSEHYTYISSSLVREISSLGGDVTDFVHEKVAKALQQRFR